MHSRERDGTPLDGEPSGGEDATTRLVGWGVAAAAFGFAWLAYRVCSSGNPCTAADVVAGALSTVGLGLIVLAAVAADRERRVSAARGADLAATNRELHERRIGKYDLLASVSHELRTPLNVVLGYVDLLLDDSFGAMTPAQRDILQRITRNTSNLSSLINDLVDLSRIEANRLRLKMASVELEPLFADLRWVMNALFAGREVTFEASIAPGCERVHADPDRLKQIVSSLLVNAGKLMKRGVIQLAAAPDVQGRVAITVTDTERGMSPAQHQAIFETFHPVPTRARRTSGAGIGLSLASRSALLTNGALRTDGTAGRSSRVLLLLDPAPASRSQSGQIRDREAS